MMKRTVIGATLVAGFAGAASVSANTTVGLRGSDTLFDLTTAMLNQCPGAVGPYSGGGSGVGQSAMGNGTQSVSPMSRFLNNGACTGALDSGLTTNVTDAGRTLPTLAEGLVIGLDGISILGWTQTFAYSGDGGDPVGCNGHTNSTCEGRPEDGGVATAEMLSGAAYNTTITLDAACGGGTYTFTTWRDVLRVLLAGFDHSAAANGTGATGAVWSARDCNSCLRQSLANHYGNFFENQCTAAAGDPTPCTRIRHVFRRDDFSGTTDTVISLLNLPASTTPEVGVTLNTNGTPTTVTNHTGATPFCNAVRPAFVFAAPQPTCPVGSDNTWDPTVCSTVEGTAAPCNATNVAANTCTDPVSGRRKEKVVYRTAMQDNDPIRRLCGGTGVPNTSSEQVCHHGPGGQRSLGLVIPIVDVPEPNYAVLPSGTNDDRYQLDAAHAPIPCVNGSFATAPAPNMYDFAQQTPKINLNGALCPNGDTAPLGCKVPATAAGSAKCIAVVNQAPALANIAGGTPLINPAGPALAEGRQYNQHLYADGAQARSAVYQRGAFVTTGLLTSFEVTGAYYRIHTSASLNANGKRCTAPDATDQIGCLVEANPCSLGYAGRSATETNPATDAIKINAQSPTDQCIQGSVALGIPGFKYPLARKLYLNTLVGFQNVGGQELNLSGCETDLPQPSLGNASGGFISNHALTTSIFLNHFVDLPGDYNNGKPFCEDFNENMLCTGFGANVVACATPKANFDNFPTPAVGTTCGNGTVEKFEDCDCGTTASGTSDTRCAGSVNGGTFCTTTCRFVN